MTAQGTPIPLGSTVQVPSAMECYGGQKPHRSHHLPMVPGESQVCWSLSHLKLSLHGCQALCQLVCEQPLKNCPSPTPFNANFPISVPNYPISVPKPRPTHGPCPAVNPRLVRHLPPRAIRHPVHPGSGAARSTQASTGPGVAAIKQACHCCRSIDLQKPFRHIGNYQSTKLPKRN